MNESFPEYNSYSKEDLAKILPELEFEIEQQKAIIEEEDHKFENYRIENERRQHNYIPIIFDLLKIMAEKNCLEEVYNEAKKEEEARSKNQTQK